MIMGLFSAKSSHPLADARELKKVLEGLLTMTAAAGLDETRIWLESLETAEDLKPDERLAIILQLDEATMPHARRHGREFLSDTPLGRSEEYRLWNANHNYWKQLVSTYEACLQSIRASGKWPKSLEAQQALAYARILMAYASVIKWAMFRHGPIDGNYWQGAGAVYLAAQAAKLQGKTVLPYPHGRETSVGLEYLQLLMLHSSSANKLMPVKVEIAERLVAYLVPDLVFTDQVDPANVYWVDISKPLPPTRLAKLPELTPTLRFLRPGAAMGKIAAIKAAIEKDGVVPPDLQLGGQYPADMVLSVLDHLSLNWQDAPPMRSHQRRQIKSKLAVIHGLATIHDRLTIGRSYFDDTPADEEWLVDDLSMGGMGAQSPFSTNDWIRIGALIAMQPEGGDNWLIGMVRRYQRGEKRGAAGIQTLGKAPRAIVADGRGLATSLLLLNLTALPVAGQAMSVDGVMASDDFEPGIALQALVDNQKLRIIPQSLVERGPDFIIVRFQIEAIPAGALAS